MRGPSLAVVSLCRCVCLRGLGCLSVVVVLLFVDGWAPLFSFGCLVVVGSSPLTVDASLPPAAGPLWRPGPVFTLVPPSGYLVAFVTAWLPCLPAGGVVVLCRPYFMLSHGSKGVGFVPSTPCCMSLSITTLRYSSMMIQVPHWTPLSFTIAILKQ